MADALDDLTRLALFEAWGERCVWCHVPLYFNEMEVEHLLPKTLVGKDNADLFRAQGLNNDFDLLSLENLAPSCGPCNRGKGKRPPPEAPVIASVLRTAKERAPTVETNAGKLRNRRQITRAVTILREGAKGGDEAALAALREAAEQVTLEFREATGLEVRRLDSTFDRLASVGEVLARSDPHFFYPATTHESDGPAPPLTPGSVMSVHTMSGNVTSRIDVVPRDAEALDRYGPQFRLSPSEGETGEIAAALLEDALREGRSVEISQGLDVTVERMPPALDEFVGQRLEGGTVRLERTAAPGRRPIPDLVALLRAETNLGAKSLPMRLRQADTPPEGFQDALVGQFGGLTVTAAMRWRDDRGGQIRWNFTHRRDDSSVADQLRALEFLAALSDGGEFVVTDRGATNRPEQRVAVSPGDFRTTGGALLAFLGDLRVLEEWAGVEFQLPSEIRGEEARDIAVLAQIIRDGGRAVTWDNASFVIPESTLDEIRSGSVVGIEQNVSASILGLPVELGQAQKELPAYEVVSVKPLKDQAGYVEVRIEPPDADAASIFERLVKPSGRKRKPPPPPPKRVARDRKRRKNNKKTKRR